MVPNAEMRQVLWRAVDLGRRALAWWLDELSHLIPSRVRRVWGTDAIVVTILLQDDGAEVQHTGTGVLSGARPPQASHQGNQQSALAWVAEQRRRWGALMKIDVALPAARCLIRHRRVPAAAADRIREILALELEQSTPFASGDVRQGWRLIGPAPAGEGGLEVEHVVAKRGLIDPVLAEARGVGVRISKVDVMDSQGRLMGINLLTRAEVPLSLAERLNWAIGTAAALLLVVSVAVGLIVLQRQDQAMAHLAAETSAARKEAQDVRQRVQDAEGLLERVGRLRERRADGPRVIALWEELTKLLPDTAWLTDVRVEDNVVWIDGYAQAASELVGAIAQSPMFSAVALSSAVTREVQRGTERFQIRMKLERAKGSGIGAKSERP